MCVQELQNEFLARVFKDTGYLTARFFTPSGKLKFAEFKKEVEFLYRVEGSFPSRMRRQVQSQADFDSLPQWFKTLMRWPNDWPTFSGGKVL